MSKDVQFIDAESYQGGGINDKITFRIIVLEHIRRLFSLGSEEWHGGYWKDVSYGVNNLIGTTQVYVPNTRKKFNNAVWTLYDFLEPHLDQKGIEAFKEAQKKGVDQCEELYKEYAVKNEEGRWEFRNKTYKAMFEDEKIDLLTRPLLRVLSRFLKSTDYLAGRTFEEEV